ncbi:MAG: tetratricopeptide repeat protein [Gemmataceae bacterium]|nr:tetratricopeptide repeat protein [Gemmataceae bacterium]
MPKKCWRYETANGLARDVQRYLADEPVQACPPSAGYRLRKFARRHKVGLTTAALVAAALVIGITAATWQAVRAWQAEELAQARAGHSDVNFRKALEAVDQMLTEVGQKELAPVPHLEEVRRTLLEKALSFYEGFLQEKSSDPPIQLQTGMACRRVGHLRHWLGRHDQAEQAYERGIALLEQLAGRYPNEPSYRQELARSYAGRARLFREVGRSAEADQACRQALKLQEQLVADAPAERDYRRDLARSLFLLALSPNLPDTEALHRRALRLLDQLVAEDPTRFGYAEDWGKCLNALANLLSRTDRLKEAEDAYRQAIARAEKILVAYPRERDYQCLLGVTHNNFGKLLWDTGRLGDARQHFRQALKLNKQLADDFPRVPEYQWWVAMSLNNLGAVLWQNGRPAEAEKEYANARIILEKLVADLPRVPDYRHQLGSTLGNLGLLLQQRREFEQARLLLELDVEHQQAALKIDPRNRKYREDLAAAYLNLGIVLDNLKAPKTENVKRKAVGLYRQLADEFPKDPHYRSTTGGALNNLASFLLDRGQPEQARQLFEEAIEHQQAALKVNPRSPASREFLRNHHKNLGKTLWRLGQADAAEEAYRHAITGGKELVEEFPLKQDYRKTLAELYVLFGNLLDGTGRTHEQEQAYREALVHWQKLTADSPNVAEYQHGCGEALHNLAAVFGKRGEPEKARALVVDAIHHRRIAWKANPQQPNYREALAEEYVDLARALVELRDHAGAAEAIAEMLSLRPERWKSYFHAAGLLQRCAALATNDVQLAEAERKGLARTYQVRIRELHWQAAARNPDQPDSQNNLAWFLGNCPDPKYRDPARAVEFAQKAVRRHPKNGFYRGTLGMAHYRAGDWQAAVAELEKAQRLGTGGETHFFLAMAYWRLDDKGEARKSYNRAVQWMEANRKRLDRLDRRSPEYGEVRLFRQEAARLLGINDQSN